MSNSVATETFVVEGVVLSYPNLFAPRQVNGKGEPVYSAKLYYPPAAASVVYQKMQELAIQGFPNNESAQQNFRWPVSPVSGADLQNPRFTGFYVGNSKANADYPPQIVDQNRQPLMDRGQIYAGVVCAVGIRLYTYNNMGQIGIGCGLMAVMKTADGEPLVETADVNALFGNVQASAPQPGMSMPGGAPAPQTQAAPAGMPTPAAPPVPAGPVGTPAPQQPVPGGAPAPQTQAAPAGMPMPTAPFPQ